MSQGISRAPNTTSPSPSSSQHVTVLLDEAVAALNIKADGIYVDATFGRGGHSRKILQQLGPQGRLVALDRDLAAVEAAQDIQDPRFLIVHSPFAALQAVLDDAAITHVDGVLLDNSSVSLLSQRLGTGGFDYGTPVSDLNVEDIQSVRLLRGPALLR